MKKLLLILIVALSLVSCKKDKKEGSVCWTCRTALDGSTQIRCDEGQGQFTDAQGNDMSCWKNP